jgi:hypothetical protein
MSLFHSPFGVMLFSHANVKALRDAMEGCGGFPDPSPISTQRPIHHGYSPLSQVHL